eukprot:354360-Chlamydomonas_euryale.AAC.1
MGAVGMRQEGPKARVGRRSDGGGLHQPKADRRGWQGALTRAGRLDEMFRPDWRGALMKAGWTGRTGVAEGCVDLGRWGEKGKG